MTCLDAMPPEGSRSMKYTSMVGQNVRVLKSEAFRCLLELEEFKKAVRPV